MSDPRENGESSNCKPRSRLFFAGFLIVAGTLLFLGNLGILPSFNIWSFWPLLIVALGISKIANSRDSANRLLGFLLSFFGLFFLLVTLGLIQIRARDHSWPISMLLIAFGLAMLIKVLEERDPARPMWTGFRPLRRSTPNGLSDFTVMGTVKRRVDTVDYRGGNALSVLGNIELDLRHARITDPSQIVHLEVSAILGSAKIRVPENWRVQMHGASILGTYEDKTIPPNTAAAAPTLVITGFSFMSAVEVED
jgi:predicted membrane protein